MATVRAFEMKAVKVWFWSEDHEPPHFHAKKSGEWEVKVWFLLVPSQMIEVVWSEKKPSSTTLKNLRTLAERHRAELLEQWSAIHEPRA